MMRIPKRDLVATCLVAAAVVLYLLWLADVALPGMDSTRATGLVILALGFAASATAVVPGFDQLLHGDRTYLAATSLLGLVAFVAGVAMVWSAGSTTLTVLVVMMAVLWVVATTHHTRLARTTPSSSVRGTR
jgi:uncharacterized membrane protein YqgA involved in biofilm formation